jgi:mannose-6-phosphate isomerase-like protein (cupin superfamily)
VLQRGEETGGQVSVMEIGASSERTRPKLHHHGFDETFYLLEGEQTNSRA